MKSYCNFSVITKDETTLLKGYAILIIIFHNLYRWITPKTWDNEFTFNSTLFKGVFEAIANDPFEIGNALFSYFGHYGVQVFLILSAYGVVHSYTKKQPSWWQFMKERYIKIYPSFIIAVLAWMAFKILFQNDSIGRWDINRSLQLLSTIGNFFPNNISTSLVGPWWFYSLIFQVYAVLPLSIWLVQKRGAIWLLYLSLIGYAITIITHYVDMPYKYDTLYTIFGHTPEVMFGIWLAFQKEIRLPYWVIPTAIIVFVAGCLFKPAWFFASLSIGIILVFGLLWLVRKTISWQFLTKPMRFIGEISLYMFAINGFIREPFVAYAEKQGTTTVNTIVGIAFLLSVVLGAFILTKVENIYRNYVIQGTSFNNKAFRVLVPLCICMGILFVLNKF